VGGRRVVFLDRDGTINVDTGAVHRVADWRFEDGAVEGLKALQDAGYGLAVVTNQAAIADGRTSVEQVEAIHAFMTQELAAAGVTIDAIGYCPHHRDADCACRKPRTGLFDTMATRIGPIDLGQSWMVGDKESDIGFGKSIGVRTVLIRSRYWDLDTLKTKPDLITDSLLGFSLGLLN
jgi:D-glycero-D-manno-heptose 1,7-bisphosphate phosphatase